MTISDNAIPVIVCGSRSFQQGILLPYVMQMCVRFIDQILLIDGDCPTGADMYNDLIMHRGYGLPRKAFPALWDTYGRSAGHRRNMQMAAYAAKLKLISGQGYCFAFWDRVSPGTKSMIGYAKDAGITTIVHLYRGHDLYFASHLREAQDEWLAAAKLHKLIK